jgi:hypothetical protein
LCLGLPLRLFQLLDALQPLDVAGQGVDVLVDGLPIGLLFGGQVPLLVVRLVGDLTQTGGECGTLLAEFFDARHDWRPLIGVFTEGRQPVQKRKQRQPLGEGFG